MFKLKPFWQQDGQKNAQITTKNTEAILKEWIHLSIHIHIYYNYDFFMILDHDFFMIH